MLWAISWDMWQHWNSTLHKTQARQADTQRGDNLASQTDIHNRCMGNTKSRPTTFPDAIGENYLGYTSNETTVD